MVQGIDPYEILGVSRGANLRDIHHAWRRLARLNHPDRYPPAERPVQTAVAQQINFAWESIQRERASSSGGLFHGAVSAESGIEQVLHLLYQRIVEKVELPSRDPVTAPLPKELWGSPAAEGLPGLLYRHQAKSLEILLRRENAVICTGTASGKSLIFQTWILHRLIREPDATAIVWYPLKALATDQLEKWIERARKSGFPVEQINRIDGDVPQSERYTILSNTRVAIMTPDICHAWLLRHRGNPAVKNFLRRLRLLVLDEAHEYENVFGSHVALLLRRLEAAHQDEAQGYGGRLQYVAASATIQEPAQHLEKLTGFPFTAVTESDDGAPLSQRTLAHVAAPDKGVGREHALSDMLTDVLQLPDPPKFIAFLDSRQGVERVVRTLREKAGDLSQRVQPYRSGYETNDRRAIERALRDGRLSGVIATSALELGIDIPQLDLGINAGLPDSRKSLRQRVGRIGRQRPGAFLILAEYDAFQRYSDTLSRYWQRSVEPSHLHLDNRVFQFIHAHCLSRESGSPKVFDVALKNISWPKDFDSIARDVWNGQSFPEFDPIADTVIKGVRSPHSEWQIRDISLPEQKIVEESGRRRLGKISAEQAIRETYPGACYLHLQQGWRITGWRDQSAGPPIIQARQLIGNSPPVDPNALPEANRIQSLPPPGGTGRDTYRRTDPVLEFNAVVHLNRDRIIDGRIVSRPDGILAETWVDLTQSVTGWKEEGRTYEYEDYLSRRPGLKPRSIEIPTTGVLVQLRQSCFSAPMVRRRIASNLTALLRHDKSIPLGNVDWAIEGIASQNDIGGREPLSDCILIYDTVYGGMRLTAALYENLPEYAQRMQQANKTRPQASRQASAANSTDVFQLFADFANSLRSTHTSSLATPLR